ncbi:TetR/AcrR family transcriptional regulator [Olivibacter sitiensis]|uniref:TetR/AcrR family transcriptional regulator n=1 Tax=Olivibacter sitiensis TaxID=376470 RepID=UPI0003F5F586|nr:TetR/AcrR family transcriptional regulator [Olivibacter sitiensis]
MARKVYDGPIRNKERTKKKLLDAVGEILTEEGYVELGVNRVMKQAKLDKKLLYEYFGGIDGLITTYLREQDYWLKYAERAKGVITGLPNQNIKELTKSILKDQLDYLDDNREMQQIVRWQISEKTEALQKICEEREAVGAKLFSLFEPNFDGRNVDIEAEIAILVAGIYFLVLHAKVGNSLFCGIDLNEEDGKSRIHQALDNMVERIYKNEKA